ncbi:MAG: hypothetical protein U9P49_04620 [Thermodesulfobacteriota bacterium]|nr:hypothetical protein [Thermodesulfobacteriota bacterium]
MTKRSRSEDEQRLLNEIRDLPDSGISKILKIVHFFKEEFLEVEKPKEDALRLFWESFGS